MATPAIDNRVTEIFNTMQANAGAPIGGGIFGPIWGIIKTILMGLLGGTGLGGCFGGGGGGTAPPGVVQAVTNPTSEQDYALWHSIKRHTRRSPWLAVPMYNAFRTRGNALRAEDVNAMYVEANPSSNQDPVPATV